MYDGTGIQKAVSSINEGAGARLLRALIFICGALVLFAVYAHSHSPGFKDPETMEEAQVARNMARGKGFTTLCLRPSDFGYFTRLSDGRVPDIRNEPVYPALLSALFKGINPPDRMERSLLHPGMKVFAPEQRAVIPFAVLLSIASAGILFMLGNKLFNPNTGILSAVLFLLSDTVLYQGISGSRIPLLTFFCLISFYAALPSGTKRPGKDSGMRILRRAAFAAVPCALAFLTDYSAAALFPCLAALTGLSHGRFRPGATIVFAAVFAAIIFPWLARNIEISQRPLGAAPDRVMLNSEKHPGRTFERTPSARVSLPSLVRAARQKVLRNIPQAVDLFRRNCGHGLILCLFLLSLFVPSRSYESGALKWFTASAGLLMVLFLAVSGDTDSSLPAILLPPVTLAGAAFFLQIIEKHTPPVAEWRALPVTALACLAAVATAAATWRNEREESAAARASAFIDYTEQFMRNGDTICTDIPRATAWYANRTSLLLPVSVEEFRKINKEHLTINALYLTPRTTDKPYTTGLRDGPDNSWLGIINGSVPEDFPLTHGLYMPFEKHEHLFLTTSIADSPSSR